MSKTLNTTIGIQLVDDDTNTTMRFLSELLTLEPGEYQYGKLSLAAGDDELLCESINYIFFKASDEVGYKIGETGDQHLGDSFLHKGEAVDIYLTNSSSSTIIVEYVFSIYA